MKCSSRLALAWVVGLGLVAGHLTAAPAEEGKAAAAPEFKLPKGWTQEDLQACIQAGTPGEMHKLIAGQGGKWTGKQTMWMAPDVDPSTSECSAVCTSMMDGKFTKCDFSSDIPGMGPYKGLGIVGYDNVSKKFQGIWLDNHSTGMMIGTGTLSADGKTITWKYEHSCPLTKKPTIMREIETFTGPDSKTWEMFGVDPKSGKEVQMMKIELKRASHSQASR
jgi:hypothetical protein